MDETRFEKPQDFIPERYADYPLSAPEYAAMTGDDVRDHWGYGYGRRICVGVSTDFLAHDEVRSLISLYRFSFISCVHLRVPLARAR